MNFKDFFESSKSFDELMLIAEGSSQEYAVDILDKITKVAEYLIKSKLNDSNDLARFEKFLDMIEKELPKLTKSVEAIRHDISRASGISQTPRRYNYYK